MNTSTDTLSAAGSFAIGYSFIITIYIFIFIAIFACIVAVPIQELSQPSSSSHYNRPSFNQQSSSSQPRIQPDPDQERPPPYSSINQPQQPQQSSEARPLWHPRGPGF
jgi:predicted lipid-binding transport protein (Tim44 family)